MHILIYCVVLEKQKRKKQFLTIFEDLKQSYIMNILC